MGVGGASSGAIGGFGVVSGPRSSCSLHCVRSACETMFAASEMVGPLVSEGVVVSECAVYRERRFRGGQWSPIQLFFALRTQQCLAPWFRRGLLFQKRSCEHGRNVRVCELVLVLVLPCELCCSRSWGFLPGRKPSLASPLPSSAQIPPQPSSHRAFTYATRPS